MKKALKITAVILASVMLCLSLCSCDMIDELRSQDAKWEVYGESFVLGEKKFHRVGSSNQISLTMRDSYDASYIYLSKPEVPLLISWFMNRTASYSEQDELVGHGTEIYATERNYDYFKKIFDNPDEELTNFGYFNVEESEDGQWHDEFIMVSDEYSTVLRELCELNKTEQAYLLNDATSEECLSLRCCDEKGLIYYSDYESMILIYANAGKLLFSRNHVEFYEISEEHYSVLNELHRSIYGYGLPI